MRPPLTYDAGHRWMHFLPPKEVEEMLSLLLSFALMRAHQF